MKGTVNDLIIIIIVAIALPIVIFSMIYLNNTVDTQLTGTEHYNDTYMADSKASVQILNTAFIFVLIGGVISIIILAFMIPTHPLFAIPSILVVIVLVVVAAQITNVYEDIATTDEFAPIEADFQLITTILQNLPLIIGASGIAIIIALFLKSKIGVENI